MKLGRRTVGRSAGTLLAITVLLGVFAYYYAATASQISTLGKQITALNNRVSAFKEAARVFCQYFGTLAPSLPTLVDNVTTILQSQIRTDNSLVAVLNSTKPAGYAGMVATLQNEVAHDQGVLKEIRLVNPALALTAVPNYCAAFIQPQPAPPAA